MVSNKSIDGLSPRRRKKPAASVNADGFSPLTKPRKTSYSSSTKTTRVAQSPSSADTLHPEDFIPPRQTIKHTPQELPELSEPTSHPKSTQEVNEDFLEPLKTFDFNEETGELVNAKAQTESDQKSQKPQSKKTAQPSKKRKKWSKKRKIWTWIGIVFLLIIIAGIVGFILWSNDLLAKLTGGRGNLMDLFSETYDPLKEDANGRTNVLLFGTSGFDMEGTEFGGGVHDGADLTDSIMVVSFDQDTGDAALISLPRDLYIDADCNYTGKINEIYACNNPDDNNENAGAEALQTAVGDILGLDIPYYAHLNWGSLQEIVDALGGITITLDEPIEDYDYTGAVYEAGVPYHLSGGDAIGLARARHGTENGDFSRGASQQKILLGIKDKVLQDGLSVSSLLSIASTLGDNLRTNFTVGEMKTLAHIATTIDWNNIVEVSFLSPEPLLTDGMIDGISYVYPTAGISDFSEIRAYVKSILASQDSVAKENATILVLNSTGTPSLASTEQADLEEDGFANITIDNYSSPTATPYTLYVFSPDKTTTQSALEQKYTITALDGTTAPTDLPTDYDFVLIIGG